MNIYINFKDKKSILEPDHPVYKNEKNSTAREVSDVSVYLNKNSEQIEKLMKIPMVDFVQLRGYFIQCQDFKKKDCKYLFYYFFKIYSIKQKLVKLKLITAIVHFVFCI